MPPKDPSQGKPELNPSSPSTSSTNQPKELDVEQIKDYIREHEGTRTTAYPDTQGHVTIGVGFNLDRPDAKEQIEALGLNYDDVRSGKTSLSQSQIDTLYDNHINEAVDAARNNVSNFDDLSSERQAVVVDMAFNLGETRFATFQNTIDAIENNDFDTAAKEMEDSDWFDQVGDRAKEDIDMMKGDVSFSGS